LARTEGIRGLRIEVIHYGFNLDQWHQFMLGGSYAVPKKSGVYRFACVSRLERQKRIFDTLTAFKILHSKVPNVELLIFGEGRERGKLEEWIVDEALQEVIFLPGRVQNIAYELGAADVFVHSSSYEGFGLVYLEAIASGLPIISSRHSTAHEVLGDGLAFFFEVGDTKELAKLMEKVCHLIESGWSPPLETYKAKLTRFSCKQNANLTTEFYRCLT